MRYSEREPNYEIKSPIDTIKVISSLIILSPFRLLSEIGKRFLFLEDEAEKCLLYTIILNSVIFVFSVVSSLLWTKKLYVWYGFMPLSSIAVSIAISIFSHYMFNRVNCPIDLDKLDEIEKDKALDDITAAHCEESDIKREDSTATSESDDSSDKLEDSVIDSVKPSCSKTELSALDRLMSLSKNNDSTITETLMDTDEEFDEIDIADVLNVSPKSSIDDLYKHENKRGDDIMLKGLKNAVMRNAYKKDYQEEGLRLTDKEHLAKVAEEIGFDEELIHKNAELEKEYLEDVHGEVCDKLHEEANKKVDALMNNKNGVDFIDTDFDFDF